jgi:rhamnulokinase
MQAAGCGEIGSLAQAREVVRNSFDMVTYEPTSSAAWNEAYEHFVRMLDNHGSDD